MSRKAKVLFLLMTIATIYLRADDGAASIAEGGVVMSREPRVTMAKEVLQISASKVIVDYDFRNDSDADITTDVAFPIPPYGPGIEAEPSVEGFEDFLLSIDGKPARYLTEARAFIKDKEYTRLLTSMHVDVASFGHRTKNGDSLDLQKLTVLQRERLEKLPLVERDAPNWTVVKKYYWQQTFPAHKIVHIRHEYSPFAGASNSIKYGLGSSPNPDSAKELKSLCIDGRLHSLLQQIADSKDRDAPYSYVDFILTTANTWKTPIEDFTLLVQRVHEKDSLGDYVSFCWDGPITKVDADHFSAHAINFIPTRELRIGFFEVEQSRF